MSLTQDDLLQIRTIVEDVVDRKTRSIVEDVVERKIDPLRGEVQAFRNDIKEIYTMIAKLEKRAVVIDEAFYDLPPKEQILQVHGVLKALAEKHHVVLPQ